MIRKIIQIDSDKCNGCGLCASACHEGAIAMVEGKARLVRDDYCDGLGDCLPVCPVNAITFVEREAAAYDQKAVDARLKGRIQGGCPGTAAKSLVPAESAPLPANSEPSQLRQWPVQLRLVPVTAPYFAGADLLLAADCAACAYGGFHRDFLKGRVLLIGCPKLDGVDYSQKLGGILRENDIKSLTVVRMEAPCCGDIAAAAEAARRESGRQIPWQVITLAVDGTILPEKGSV